MKISKRFFFLSLVTLGFGGPASADCSSQPIVLTLESESSAACHELGIEGKFILDTCEGQGLLKGGGQQKFLQSYGTAWYFRADQFDPEKQRRLVEVLWLDPENKKYSYASSAQVNGGYFERVADCKGELTPNP